MSVLVLDTKAYDAVYHKAWMYGFNKTCDINYCSTLSYGNEEILKQVIKDWLWLNEMSWLRRYQEEGKPNLEPFLTFRCKKTIDTYQMLKHLECIKYNIELPTIKTGYTGREEPIIIPQDKMDSYNILIRAIDEIKSVIIAEIPEYQEAKWGDF